MTLISNSLDWDVSTQESGRRHSQGRLDAATRRAWVVDLCAAHAPPALVSVDDHTRLSHADINRKNILVTRTRSNWLEPRQPSHSRSVAPTDLPRTHPPIWTSACV